MRKIVYLDRSTRQKKTEKVYGERILFLVYENHLLSQSFGLLLRWFTRIPFFSSLYGWFQKTKISSRKIRPFIKDFNIDSSEFVKDINAFDSFNDFFIRKLKSSARPIAPGNNRALLPADGRYLVYPDINLADGFLVKGKKFSLSSFLQDDVLAKNYQKGSMVLARLCPIDYHRFHFPIDCVPDEAQKINGFLYSVNPIALKRNIEIFCENRRVVTQLTSDLFGKVFFVEIGATNVGTICQTFTPGKKAIKGDEKGYFSFGGSAIVILFEENKIQFDSDLIEASNNKIETRGFFGQSLGCLISKLK